MDLGEHHDGSIGFIYLVEKLTAAEGLNLDYSTFFRDHESMGRREEIGDVPTSTVTQDVVTRLTEGKNYEILCIHYLVNLIGSAHMQCMPNVIR